MSADATARPADLGLEREAARQQALMAALSQPEAVPDPAWWAAGPVPAARGLLAYQINAEASAERALAATFPVVRALVGAAGFGRLARAYARAWPAERGDLAWLGRDGPGFLAADERLADLPYLAALARLEWALARAEVAPDLHLDTASLARLAEDDPSRLWLLPAPGLAALDSPWPLVALWQAHGPADAGSPAGPDEDPADAASLALAGPLLCLDPAALPALREALRAAAPDMPPRLHLAWRPVGPPAPVRCHTLAAGPAALWRAVLAGLPLGDAVAAAADADPAFDFGTWLGEALAAGQIAGLAGQAPDAPRGFTPP